MALNMANLVDSPWTDLPFFLKLLYVKVTGIKLSGRPNTGVAISLILRRDEWL